MINDPRSHLIPEASSPSRSPSDLDPRGFSYPQRPEITLGVRIVENGAILWMSSKNTGPQFTAPPESVATSVDQAVECFRDMLTKVWPRGK